MVKTTVQTTQKTEVINVTEQLAGLIGETANEIAVFSTPHTTAALILCEDDDELRADLVRVAENVFGQMRPFRHIRKNNPNAEAHILSAFAGTTLTIAIVDGKLDLGTYQNALFLEMDGPKLRDIRCTIVRSD